MWLHLDERLAEPVRVGSKVRARFRGEVRTGIGVRGEVRVRVRRARVGLGATLPTCRCSP